MKVESKIVRAKCSKTDKKFLVEASKFGSEYSITNFIDIDELRYSKVHSQIDGSNLKTDERILPCLICGSRKIASCGCVMKNKVCHADDKYQYQCIYCPNLSIERPASSRKIYVNRPKYDDIGSILKSMNISYLPFTSRYDCDILFLNCGSDDTMIASQLERFVRESGCLYASDWASKTISAAFPDMLTFENNGISGNVNAYVVDQELSDVIGRHIQIEYDLGAWSVVKSTTGTVLLKADSTNSRYANMPIMIMKKYGKGIVFYTSFHNHAQSSEKEKMLLQLLVLKQLSEISNVSLDQMSELIGLNIQVMKEKFSS